MRVKQTLSCLWHAYRALRAGKHPEDLQRMLAYMSENAESDTIREFTMDAEDAVGTNVQEITLEKEGVDFSAEATVLFMLGVRWERHDIFTGDDL